MDQPATLDLGRIAQDLQIRKVQVESVVHLFDEGNTVPFITRYRKERTSGLNEEIIREIQQRVALQRQLAERKQTILRSIQGQGKLTDELQKGILAADSSKRLEDLYLPYKPKKRTLATTARERGLEPLALAIWSRDPATANLAELLPTMLNPEKELNTPDDVLAGVQHILAEQLGEIADVRMAARRVLWDTGKLVTTKADNLPDGQGMDYKDYFQFTEPVRHIPPHRILAINRGEKESALKVRLEWNPEMLQRAVFDKLPLADHPHADLLRHCALDGLQRLLVPSLEREIRRDLTEDAADHATQIFSRNLRSLLLQPPIRGQRVLAVDPGFRSGCKLVVLDEIGHPLEHAVIHPHQLLKRESRREKPEPPKEIKPKPDEGVTSPATAELPPEQAASTATPVPAAAPPEAVAAPEAVAVASMPAPEPAPAAPAPEPPQTPQRREEAKAKLEDLVRKHQAHLIAIGNGTACRETEELVAELIADKLPELAYAIVNEAGASHYSASAIGREEFPDFDATVRGTISIGRRLQDPLSELVKIDPQNIGVGLYQHDLSQRRLKESLDAVIESCVNHVGVDVNTASVPLLRRVSGLNQLSARALVDHRRQHGAFKNREQLRQVSGIGEVTYTQAAGFLKIADGENPLDTTWIHPESYPATQRLLDLLGYAPEALRDPPQLDEIRERLKQLPSEDTSKQLDLGLPTFHDIVTSLSRPGRDPREDLPKPIFKKGVLKLEDLQQGMELRGTILNVVDFGAFVDVGLKDSGLIHISQLANRYIKSPYEVVAVGDVVTVWVLNVDHERRRVSLTMIKPGTERKPPERKPAERKPAPARRPQRQAQRPAPAQTGRMVATPQSVAQAAQAQKSQEGVAAAAATAASPPPRRLQTPQPQQPQRQQQPERKPRRERPAPKLTEEALQGEQPLRSFAELAAFIAAKKQQ